MCCIIRGAIYCVVYQHRRCDMLFAVSALGLRYAVCCISIEGAIFCLLYQHWRCDVLCVVSA
jgi:hypothetical protein